MSVSCLKPRGVEPEINALYVTSEMTFLHFSKIRSTVNGAMRTVMHSDGQTDDFVNI